MIHDLLNKANAGIPPARLLHILAKITVIPDNACDPPEAALQSALQRIRA